MLLDGKTVKKELLEKLKEELLTLPRQLGLTVIQVGEDPASKVYVGQKEKMALEVGYNFNHVKLDENVTEEELLKVIDELNADELVDGILVQMPLPKHLDAKKIQNRVDPFKDVDGLCDINAGKLMHNVDTLVPCTPYGIMSMLEHYEIDVTGKNVVVIGRSDLVGKPIAQLMQNANATVTVCHSKTANLAEYTKMADILVVAIGKANFITGDMIKENAVVVDVGINRVDGKLVGDVDFASAEEIASYITPVPGGVGQMTVAELGRNVLKAHKLALTKEK
jgi:methylenetetrahydrofolate dehydrogenase (NADP+)/methenyltetrahydrofolate cyclohydrolase